MSAALVKQFELTSPFSDPGLGYVGVSGFACQRRTRTEWRIDSGDWLLDQRPRSAGTFLGMLCIKPQLALLVVPALLAAERWTDEATALVQA